ncbi:MAG: hypothetical protein V1857_02720 [archaeon]
MSKPLTAFILLIIGSAFYTFGGVAVGIMTRPPIRSAPGPGMEEVAVEPNWSAITAMATGIVCSVAIAVGALLTYTGVKKVIRLGSFVSILFSIVGFGNTFGGLLIGLALVIVGNVLLLAWKPKEKSPNESSGRHS